MDANTLRDIQAELFKAQTRKAEAEADEAWINTQTARRVYHNRQAALYESKIYHFFGTVTGSSVAHCIDTITQWDRLDPEADMKIVFNSPGGSVIDGLALYDVIVGLRAKGHKIVVEAQGMAASMGGVLLQAGDERTIGANAHVLIHEVSTGAIGKFSEIEDEVAFAKKLQERLVGILAERSTLTAAQIKKRWLRKDWWLSADEAVKFGFADRIA